MDDITSFTGRYFFLSNFYRDVAIATVLWGYPTSEHAYQASKTLNIALRQKFKDPQMTPGKSKREGRKLPLRDGWDDIKADIMLLIVRQKFTLPHLAAKLLDTGDTYLLEGNTWCDNFFGDCICDDCTEEVGQNHLGLALMKVRDELRASSS